MMREMNPPGSFKQNFKCYFIASGWPSQVFFSKGRASNPEGNGGQPTAILGMKGIITTD
jgi:hypothetical protein